MLWSVALWSLALLLIPWTAALWFADTATWFPSLAVQHAWIAFDVVFCAAPIFAALVLWRAVRRERRLARAA